MFSKDLVAPPKEHSELQDLQAQISTLEIANAKLVEDNDNLKEDADALLEARANCSELETDMKRLHERLRELRSHCNALEESNKTLDQFNKDAELDCAEFEAKLEENAKESATLREERDALHQESDTLREERDALRQELAALSEMNVKESATLLEERDALHQELAALSGKNVKESATLRKERDALIEERDALHPDMATLRETNAKESATLLEERDALRQELAALSEANRELLGEVESAIPSYSIKELCEDRSALHLKLLTLTEDFDEERKAMRQNLTTLMDQKNDLDLELLTMRVNPPIDPDEVTVSINLMREDNNKLWGEKEALRCQLNFTENENYKLHSENKNLDSTIDSMRDELQTLRQRGDNEKSCTVCDELNILSLQREKIFEEACKMNTDFAARCENCEKEIATLRDENSKLCGERDALQHVQHVLATLRDKHSELRGEKDAMLIELATLREENGMLREEIDAKSATLRDVNKRAKTKDRREDTLHQDLATLGEASVKESATLLEERDALHQELATLSEERDALRGELATLREEKDALPELAALREERDALHQESATLREERDALHQELATLREERDALHQESATLREERDTLHQESATLREANAQESATQREERDALHQESATLCEANAKESATLRGELGSLQAVNRELRGELATLAEATDKTVRVETENDYDNFVDETPIDIYDNFGDETPMASSVSEASSMSRKRNLSGGVDSETPRKRREEEVEGTPEQVEASKVAVPIPDVRTAEQVKAHDILITEVSELIAKVPLLSSTVSESTIEFEEMYRRMSAIVIEIGSTFNWEASKTICGFLASVRFGKILTRQSKNNGKRCSFGHQNKCPSYALSIGKGNGDIIWNIDTIIEHEKKGKIWNHVCPCSYQAGSIRQNFFSEIGSLLKITSPEVLSRLFLQNYFSKTLMIT